MTEADHLIQNTKLVLQFQSMKCFLTETLHCAEIGKWNITLNSGWLLKINPVICFLADQITTEIF